MPRIELTEAQKAEAAALAEKVARVMEEKPSIDARNEYEKESPSGWWYTKNGKTWLPNYSLDGTLPYADAVACARMKERLIEWFPDGLHESYYYAARSRGVFYGHKWHYTINSRASGFAPTEALAVAKALVAVEEQRKSVRYSSEPLPDDVQELVDNAPPYRPPAEQRQKEGK